MHVAWPVQGIPTTRAGSVITSDSRVTRDMFYTGDPKQERCSVVLRVAPTFIRFGSFEIFKPTDSTTGMSMTNMEPWIWPATISVYRDMTGLLCAFT